MLKKEPMLLLFSCPQPAHIYVHSVLVPSVRREALLFSSPFHCFESQALRQSQFEFNGRAVTIGRVGCPFSSQ